VVLQLQQEERGLGQVAEKLIALKGHGFSRVESGAESTRALAPERCCSANSPPVPIFLQPVELLKEQTAGNGTQSEIPQREVGMGMEIETRMSDQLARYLDLSTSEAKLTAANMANIDTPGYKAMGMDFEAEMRGAMEGVDQGREPKHVRVKAVDGLIARPDGNNVSMDREGLNLAEAQLKFKTGVALLHLEYQKILNAIHADK
jgi:flagellar basal-body rod protein FlgB